VNVKKDWKKNVFLQLDDVRLSGILTNDNSVLHIVVCDPTKIADFSLQELTIITGQKGVVRRSKKSIAGFKLREDMPVGVSVTLRKDHMYGFLDRFINLALPRIRDFDGIQAKSVDKQGNYTIGLEEQLLFPEVEYEKIDKVRGMDISIITSSKTKLEGYALLKEFGMPFQNSEAFEKINS
jgi:large subunit ribosomal protein L5